jgi:hypothetical protein
MKTINCHHTNQSRKGIYKPFCLSASCHNYHPNIYKRNPSVFSNSKEVFAIANVNSTYGKIIGAVIALVGILGFWKSPVLGLLAVNLWSNIIHLVGGALVFWKAGKQVNMWLGWIALVVGIIGFVPVVNVVTNSWLGFNTNFHILHIVIGVVSLAIAKWSD